MLWQKLTEQDLSWLQDLQPLPLMIKQTREELASLRTEVACQQKQLDNLHHLLDKQLQLSRLLLALVGVLLAGSLITLIVAAVT